MSQGLGRRGIGIVIGILTVAGSLVLMAAEVARLAGYPSAPIFGSSGALLFLAAVMGGMALTFYSLAKSNPGYARRLAGVD
jgi:hypothetical protein